MAHIDFWCGFNTTMLIIAVLALFCLIETILCSNNSSLCSLPYDYAYPGGVVLVILLFSALHYHLTKTRDRLQHKHQLRKVEGTCTPSVASVPLAGSADLLPVDIANTLYPNGGRISIRSLEM